MFAPQPLAFDAACKGARRGECPGTSALLPVQYPGSSHDALVGCKNKEDVKLLYWGINGIMSDAKLLM